MALVNTTDMLHLPMWMLRLSSHFSKIGHLQYAFTEKLLGPLFLFVVCPGINVVSDIVLWGFNFIGVVS